MDFRGVGVGGKSGKPTQLSFCQPEATLVTPPNPTALSARVTGLTNAGSVGFTSHCYTSVTRHLQDSLALIRFRFFRKVTTENELTCYVVMLNILLVTRVCEANGSSGTACAAIPDSGSARYYCVDPLPPRHTSFSPKFEIA
eukprot:1158635-Amphidinium_carterae.1